MLVGGDYGAAVSPERDANLENLMAGKELLRRYNDRFNTYMSKNVGIYPGPTGIYTAEMHAPFSAQVRAPAIGDNYSVQRWTNCPPVVASAKTLERLASFQRMDLLDMKIDRCRAENTSMKQLKNIGSSSLAMLPFATRAVQLNHRTSSSYFKNMYPNQNAIAHLSKSRIPTRSAETLDIMDRPMSRHTAAVKSGLHFDQSLDNINRSKATLPSARSRSVVKSSLKERSRSKSTKPSKKIKKTVKLKSPSTSRLGKSGTKSAKRSSKATSRSVSKNRTLNGTISSLKPGSLKKVAIPKLTQLAKKLRNY